MKYLNNIKISFLSGAKRILLTTLSCSALVSCDNWVNDTILPSNTVEESQLGSLGMLGSIVDKNYVGGPVIAGVWRAGSSASSSLLVASGAIVDEISSTAVPNSQFYKELDDDKLSPDDLTLYSSWSAIQNYRARAEDAIALVATVKVVNPNADTDLIKSKALFNARLHAGYAWMMLADYFSVSNTQRSVYVNGALVSHSDAYGKAQKYWEDALSGASAQEQRLLHSLLAKLGIHSGNYTLASAHIDQTFQAKENFQFINTVNTASNAFFTALNVNVRDAAVDATLVSALKTTAEKARIPVVKAAKGHWSLTLFAERDPLMVSDFDEMQLIRAELVTRKLVTGDADALVNSVIVKYDASGNSNLKAQPVLADFAGIRRVFLSFRGTRLIDLRRFNLNGDTKPGFLERKYQWISVPEVETHK